MSFPPLPSRDGVGASTVSLPAGPWPRMLDFLVERFTAIDAAAWQSRLARGLVVDETGAAIDAGTPYRAGATIRYYRELAYEAEVPFDAQVLYQDEHLLIADKPHFLQVMPAGARLQQTLLVRLKRQTGIEALTALHRIDRGTAGLVLFSTNAATRSQYQRLFAERRIEKRYEALAPKLDGLQFPFTRRTRLAEGEPFYRTREVEGIANSETIFESATPHGDLALYQLKPVTGKKHQLRVHMAAIGAPIVGDPFYPVLRANHADDDFSKPLKLLAKVLAFTDPVTGEARRFESRQEL